MTYNVWYVFVGSYLAMFSMTLLSCIFGFILPQLIDKYYTNWVIALMFLYFG